MEELQIGDYVVHDGGTTIHEVIGFSTGWVDCKPYIAIGWLNNQSFRKKNLTKVNLEECISKEMGKQLDTIRRSIIFELAKSIDSLNVIKKVSDNHNNIYMDLINKMKEDSKKLQQQLLSIREELGNEVQD